MQDLLNNNSATIVKIIGSGQCQQAKSSLCTDLTHFLLDYSAFEKLAHPGYGYMNLQYRSAVVTTSVMYSLMCHFDCVSTAYLMI